MNSNATGLIFMLLGVILALIMIGVMVSKRSGSGTTAPVKPDTKKPKSSGTAVKTGPDKSSSSAGTAGAAAIHNTIPEKGKAKNKTHQTVSLFSDTGAADLWVCPACETENPMGETVCCVCHSEKGR